MADNLTNVAEAHALNWLTGNSTTAPTEPFELALMTANGSDTAAGTEVTGGSYDRQAIAFTAATPGNPAANDAEIEFTNMPACTVVGFEIYDAAGTPIRWWYGAASASRTLSSGDTYRVAAGQITLALS